MRYILMPIIYLYQFLLFFYLFLETIDCEIDLSELNSNISLLELLYILDLFFSSFFFFFYSLI